MGASVMMWGCIGAGINSPIAATGSDSSHMPRMTGINLEGADIKIPDAFSADFNLVSIAFEQEHQIDVNTWIAVADDLMKTRSDLAFFELPVIDNLSAPYRWYVNNGMRSGIPDPVARARTVTVYTDRDAFLRMVDMKPDRIYTVLSDRSGKIIWRAEGPATAENIKGLYKAIGVGSK